MSIFRGDVGRNADEPLILHWTLDGAAAATAANYGTLFIADKDYEVIEAHCVYSTAGGSGAALQLTRDTGTTAPGGGTNILSSTFTLTATANTVQTRPAVGAARFIARGNRIGAADAGTLTGLVNLAVTVVLKAKP